jgi:phosphatidylserine decarboxylase
MSMIHKEGKAPIAWGFVICLIIELILYLLFLPISLLLFGILTFGNLVLISWIIFFFRNPERELTPNDNYIISPADGKIVTIEETIENEYFKEKMLLVSIFMSPFNVHFNKSPISGKVAYKKYHEGAFLIAYHPKSSELNERETVVVKNDKITVLMRQIAGIVARRIKNYTILGDYLEQGDEIGFIKFGSRIDLYLPLNMELKVKLNQKVEANKSIIGIVN